MADAQGSAQSNAGLRCPSTPFRIGLMYAAMFFVTGVSTPFLPVWLASRGLSVQDIGALIILPQLVRSTTAPAIGLVADRWRAHRLLTIGLTGLGLVALLLLSRVGGFWAALVAMVLIAFASTQMPLLEAIALAGVRQGHDYGRMRLWGSAGYVAANLAAGWVASRFGIAPVIWLMVSGAGAGFAASFLLEQPDAPQSASVAAADSRAAAPPPLTWQSVRALLAVPMMLLVLLAAAALQGAHGMYYSFGTLHWQRLGIDPRWYGFLWAIGLPTEIALFWWSGRALARLGAAGLILCGAGLSALRWTAMAFDPPLALLLPLQMVHGLTFGASHLGVTHVLAKIVPADRMATAQALYALASTLGIVSATAVAARLYPLAGGRTYLAMAAMAAAGLWAGLAIARGLARASPGFGAPS